MDTDHAPPCPYLMVDPPRSSGRALLSRLLWEWCCAHWGLSLGEVAAALAPSEADRGARDGDRDDHHVGREQVRLAARLIGGALADGAVRTFARPFGGGEPIELGAGVWEIDDFVPRFAASALDPRRPFDASAPPTHWIFVDADEGERLLRTGLGERERTPSASRPAATVAEPEALTPIPVWRVDDRFLRLPEVKSRTGMPRSTIYARIAEGRFPKQVPMKGNVAAWRQSEVDEWLANPR